MFSVLQKTCLPSKNEYSALQQKIDSFCVFLCVALSLSPALGKHYTKPLCLARGEEKQLLFQYETPGFLVASQGCVAVRGPATVLPLSLC